MKLMPACLTLCPLLGSILLIGPAAGASGSASGSMITPGSMAKRPSSTRPSSSSSSGTLPLGLSFRNSAFFCSPLVRSNGCTV